MGVYISDKDGKLKKVAGNYTFKENPNIDCLRTEIVYDMFSSDASKNWGYTSGIMGGVTVSGKDFSKYSQLIVYSVNLSSNYSLIIDLSKPVGDSYLSGSSGISQDLKADMSIQCSVSGDKTSFSVLNIGYSFFSGTSWTDRNSNNTYYVYKIEGVLKSPSMIYTGAELHDGNGISIKDGIISSTVKQLVADITFGSASSFEITDLDLQGDGGVYDIIIEPPITSAQSNFKFRLNNNSSTSAYVHSFFDIDPLGKALTIGSQSTSDGWAYLGAYGPDPNSIFMTLMSSQGRAIWTIDTVGYLGRLDFEKFFGYTVTANVTSMQILANSTLSAGLKVKIYRRLS